MSCILKYFSFLCQLKGHDASNKLVTKGFDLKFGYKNGFLEDSEALCICPCSFGLVFLNLKLSSKKLKESFINFPTFYFRPRYLTSIWEISHQTIFLGVCKGPSPNISFTS